MRKIGFMFLPTGHFIPYQSSQLHYHLWGTGPQMLFAFHGYGESGSSFAFLGEALDPKHTLIAIDLPFHGQTVWKEGLSFTPQQLDEIMQHIAVRHNPTDSDSTGPWGLIGYSMGGRIVLQLQENHPDSIDKLVLFAPDGLKVNIWYWVATRTALGNLLFRWTMRRPGWLFLLLRISNTLRLVNPSIYKFAVHYIDDRKVRHDLYTRWTTMRKFRPDPSVNHPAPPTRGQSDLRKIRPYHSLGNSGAVPQQGDLKLLPPDPPRHGSPIAASPISP
jgi:pimeloyl-ACP methyl ester carboxylesterase